MEKIEIIPYTADLRDTWEKVVMESNNGTIYHMQNFLGYHKEGRFNNFHHLIAVDGRIEAVIPGAKVLNDKGETSFSSYPGSSVGGFVLPQSYGLEDTDKVIMAFLHYLEENGFKKIEITPTPFFYGRQENQHIDFVLSREGFGFRKREMSSVIPISREIENPIALLRPSVRQALRKARKAGVEIVQDDSIEAYTAYHAILTQNLASKHNVKPVHTLEEMKDLKRRFPEKITLMVAKLQEEIVAGIWIFRANPKVAVAFYIAQKYEFQESRAVNLLYAETLLKVKEWGHKYYELGLFSVNMQPNYGLGRFKESYGGIGLFRDYFVRGG
ncbi:MAG: GNAT family N-acetyltransferase [Fibrobacteres bacterium]|nr:GNAT family N-acetyltransferase [Fibrobacterota bacterium]